MLRLFFFFFLRLTMLDLGFSLVHQTGLVVAGEAEGVEADVAGEGAVEQFGAGGEGEGLGLLGLGHVEGAGGGLPGSGVVGGGKGGGRGGGGGEDGELHGSVLGGNERRFDGRKCENLGANAFVLAMAAVHSSKIVAGRGALSQNFPRRFLGETSRRKRTSVRCNSQAPY